jgi:hypothetical protein
MNVFYSWQNDTGPELNRYLIRRCLEKSIKQINEIESIEESVRLVHRSLISIATRTFCGIIEKPSERSQSCHLQEREVI